MGKIKSTVPKFVKLNTLPLAIQCLNAIVIIILFSTYIFLTKFHFNINVQAAAPTINITPQAVQMPYKKGVPQIYTNGNISKIYDQNYSFFPNGIFAVTNEQRDQGVVPTLSNAGFNLAVTNRDQDPQFLLGQISGTNQYAINVFAGNSLGQILASASTTNSSVDISSSNLVSGITYNYSVCIPNCDVGMIVSHGSVAATSGSGSEGVVHITWDSGANFKLMLNNALTLDSNHNLDPATFDETIFNNYKSNPNVLAWWLADEPYKVAKVSGNDPSINYNNVQTVYNNHKDQTSQGIYVDEGSTQPVDDNWRRSVNLADLGGAYHYPKFYTDIPLRSFESTAYYTQQMVVGLSQNKPAIFIPQLFYGGGYQYITPGEERAQIYTALIHGATGLLHFAWDSCTARTWGISGVRPNLSTAYSNCPSGTLSLTDQGVSDATALWNSLSAQENGINKEIQQLTPILLSPTLSAPYSVLVDQTPISSAPIRTILKGYNGNYYLLAVNIDNATINTQFKFPFIVSTTALKMFENTNISITNGIMNDTFTPFATHVYKFATAGIDTDYDGFSDAIENAIGTNPNQICSTTSATDAWPPDWNKSGTVDIDDVFKIAGGFGKSTYNSDWANYKRLDLNNSGSIDINDIVTVSKYYGANVCL